MADNKPPSFCPSCGRMLDLVLPECAHCGTRIARVAKKRKKSGLPIPWGLLIMLGLYFGGIFAFTQYEFYNSPQYIAARHMRAAEQLLGPNNGRTAKLPELTEALDHLLEALKQLPEDEWCHEQVEQVVIRLQERGHRMSSEKQRLLDSLSMRFKRAEESSKPMLWVGARDIWDFNSIADLPDKIIRYSWVGGLLIFVFWLYVRLQDRKRRDAFLDDKDEERREELEELGSHRRGAGR